MKRHGGKALITALLVLLGIALAAVAQGPPPGGGPGGTGMPGGPGGTMPGRGQMGGPPRSAAIAATANAVYVVQGSTVYRLDPETLAIVAQKELPNTTLAPPGGQGPQGGEPPH